MVGCLVSVKLYYKDRFKIYHNLVQSHSTCPVNEYVALRLNGAGYEVREGSNYETNKQDWTRSVILRAVTRNVTSFCEMTSYSLKIGANVCEEHAACIFRLSS